MTINVLGIAGSPEIGGNTDLLLDKALEGCKNNKDANIKKIYACKLSISPCKSCRTCEVTENCVFEDDMRFVIDEIGRADRFVVACPVYFLSVSSQLKCLIDRCQVFWARKYLHNRRIGDEKKRAGRRGIIISAGGNSKDDIFNGLKETIKAFLATIDVAYVGDDSLMFNRLEEKDAVLKQPDYLQAAFKAGQKLME